jgi:hypothetical protein
MKLGASGITLSLIYIYVCFGLLKLSQSIENLAIPLREVSEWS